MTLSNISSEKFVEMFMLIKLLDSTVVYRKSFVHTEHPIIFFRMLTPDVSCLWDDSVGLIIDLNGIYFVRSNTCEPKASTSGYL